MNEANKSANILSKKQYDIIKWLTVVLLPAVGTLYFAFATIWNFPAGEQVLGSLLAIQTFISVLIGVSTKQYEESGEKYGGEINVTDTPEKTKFSLDLKDDPDSLKEKDEVVFKVNSP